MPFAQLVIGPPGSGKTTYCHGMHLFLAALGRKSSVVNLDPANDHVLYPCALDIRHLISVNEIMEKTGLGPNGAVIYALETLENNFDWLKEGLESLGDDYILFDCPGQVELFTHHGSLREIVSKLEKMKYRLVVVHLVDAHYCTDPSKYISVLMLSLRSMLQMDLPHVNVLSKIDLIGMYGELLFNLDFYTEVQDLSHLLPYLENDSRLSSFTSLNASICDMIESFGLVAFETLCIEDKISMTKLLSVIDRANGYVYGTSEVAHDSLFSVAVRQGWNYEGNVHDVQERWITNKKQYDEHETKQWMEEATSINIHERIE
ncbi:hypothetical protein PNEG_00261 [Pneumocystis murina B123]|uniref:GPN-loop GTPase 2 n=1 Tax=Pneumocystis murina (strain B123) TaxID=1069680 RepID=M7NSV4_PNEMU|nr:hypothetical protein PNEG_00261 [Pneumocystis murina B123]EMR11838.1 hypothetical protein PNEG_00261 [Pneumocystis murina B123]